MEWTEYVEKYFFTDHYSNYLLDWLLRHKLISGNRNSEKWNHLFETVKIWKKKYLISSELNTIASFNMWTIYLTFCEFSLPIHMEDCMEETMAIIFLIGWTLDFEDDEHEKNCFIHHSDFFHEFPSLFHYSKEQCARLSKSEFLDELQSIYHRSYESFQYHQKRPNHNPAWVKELEPHYPKFLKRIQFLSTNIHQEEIFRLNTLKLDEYMWYFVKIGTTLYFLQISDFG